MNDAHLTYPNPTIQEALCEIHFRLPDGVKWKPTLFGELFKKIQPDFPELEPVTQLGVELQLGPGGVGQSILPPQQRMRFKHGSRNLLMQLSESMLTVNALPKYPGWTQMSEDILYAWGKARDIIKPANISRIGLRYINRIEKTKSEERAGDWLAASDYIPQSVLASLPSFLLRLETRPEPESRLIVTLGEAISISKEDNKSIIMDVDCITEREIAVDNASLLKEITQLHENAWKTFSSSMTPRLERLLKGGG